MSPRSSPEPAARTLVMFAKVPDVGKVKTRLALGNPNGAGNALKDVLHRGRARALGDTEALAWSTNLYAAFVKDRVRAHAAGDYRFLLGVSEDDAPRRFAELAGGPVDCLAIEGPTMGDLLRSAFRQVLPGRVLITASDYPVLDEEIITDAFAALDHVDVVLVPAADGAYNLIGMRTFHDIFNIPAWSSGHELADTEAQLSRNGIPHVVLRQHVIRDVDTLGDLAAVMPDIDPVRAPHTAAHLQLWQNELALAV